MKHGLKTLNEVHNFYLLQNTIVNASLTDKYDDARSEQCILGVSAHRHKSMP